VAGYSILSLVGLAGLIAIVYRFTYGLATTDLTSNVAWGMWVVFYIYCIGLSAGSFLMSTIIYVFGMDKFERMGRMALLSALVALAGGLTFVFIDLGHPLRFYKVFFNWQRSSVLAWESALYIVYVAIIMAELFLLMRHDLAEMRDESTGWKKRLYSILSLGHEVRPATSEGHNSTMRKVKLLGIVGLPVAIGVHGGTGALFAVVAAKPQWFSGLFPIVFLVSALLSGAGLMLFLYSWFGRKDKYYASIVDGLRTFVVAFIVVDLILFASDLLVSLYSGIPDHIDVWNKIAFGQFWYVFWIGQLGLAWAIPLFITTWKKTRDSAFWLGIAGGSIVLGIIAVRLNLVIPAYLHPQLPGLDEALTNSRSAYEYFPSGIEWISTLGISSLLILAFIIAWHHLPVFEREPGEDIQHNELNEGVSA